jgi:hypothetical protein
LKGGAADFDSKRRDIELLLTRDRLESTDYADSADYSVHTDELWDRLSSIGGRERREAP